jgi:predicted ATPase
MRLHRLEIHNYKSLRNVAIEPTPLSVFVGPNAAGKTNLADALDFLGHAYLWGLERAVAYKGGYENIVFRGMGRSKEPIRFRVVFEIPKVLRAAKGRFSMEPLRVDHSFEFRATSRGSRAPLTAKTEQLVLARSQNGDFKATRRFVRKERKVEFENYDVDENEVKDLEYYIEGDEAKKEPGDSLILLCILMSSLSQSSGFMFDSDAAMRKIFADNLGALRVFQLEPQSCRESGAPTSNADLDRSGRNLPVALDNLKKEHPREYSLVLEMARRVMPTLEAIATDWTHTRSLALFLKEKGVQRHWASQDISVGTLQTIALLVATLSPGTPLVVIEEPENSVHPWALRNLVDAFRAASEKKQIMLTTHSPILIDQLKPEEVWVVRKPGTETKIDPLLGLDPSLKESWGQGKFTLSEYLDSGAVPEAVPAAKS